MVEALTIRTRLLVVREIQEDEGDVELRFQQGSHGRLDLHEANSATYLRLALRSHERQHPVGVTFGEGDTIAELIRADNDVPLQLWEEEPDRVRVHFQGHDGVFCLKRDHPEFTRISMLVGDAIRQKVRVWFVAQKPALALLDVLPAGWAVASSQTHNGGGSTAAVEFVDGPLDGLRFEHTQINTIARIMPASGVALQIRGFELKIEQPTDDGP